MANRLPIVNVNGTLKQLPSGDTLTPNPQNQTFTYSGGQLVTIVSASGTQTITYSGSRVATITDTGSNTLSTYNYTAGKLSSIVVTSL